MDNASVETDVAQYKVIIAPKGNRDFSKGKNVRNIALVHLTAWTVGTAAQVWTKISATSSSLNL